MSRRLTDPLPLRAPSKREPAVAVVALGALGANLGDRGATLQAAVRALARLPLVDRVVASEPVESVARKPAGTDAAAAPLHAVALVTTRLAPSVLLGCLHAIEADDGRTRGGDRALDLDLIAYGDVRADGAALTLPHPRAFERDDVLAPWLALDPDAVLPGRGRVDALLAALRERT
ncbi:MAG: 2-amino-4-hydroxy-6-hydroxymethyldihydropteridine diphosphokinase [Microbacterium sp.]